MASHDVDIHGAVTIYMMASLQFPLNFSNDICSAEHFFARIFILDPHLKSFRNGNRKRFFMAKVGRFVTAEGLLISTWRVRRVE